MNRLADSRGTGLVLSLLAMVSFLVVTTGLVYAVRQLKSEGIYQAGLVEAQNIAEACAQDALLSLSSNANWSAGFSNKTFADGYYNASVDVTAPATPVVTCTGYGPRIGVLDRPFRTIRFTTQFAPVTTMASGLYAKILGSSSTLTYVDAYNSESDPNGSSRTSTAFVQASTMTLFNSAGQIKGNAWYWNAPAPTSGAGKQVLGTVSQSSSAFTTINVGNYAAVNNNSSGGIYPATVFNGTDLVVPSGTNATITTGVYWVRDLKANFSSGANLGTLTVNPTNGPVVIYVTRTMDIEGDLCNPSKRPGNLFIYGAAASAQSFTVYSTYCNFYGVIAGQNVTLHADYVSYGAFAVNACYLEDTGAGMPWIGILHADSTLSSSANLVQVVPGTWQFLAKRY